MSEQALLNSILVLCRKLGLLVYHGYDGYHVSQPGYPDLTVLGSRLLLRELKVGFGTLSVVQMDWQLAFKAAGADYAVWTEDDWWCGRIQRELQELAKELAA